jgi:hypothetical protein
MYIFFRVPGCHCGPRITLAPQQYNKKTPSLCQAAIFSSYSSSSSHILVARVTITITIAIVTAPKFPPAAC